MDDGDVVVGIGPVGMRRADVDIGFGRHAGMANAVGALELPQAVLVGHLAGIAEILDQLERVAHRKDFRAFDVLDIIGKLFHVAVILDAIAEGVFRRVFPVDDLHAERSEALVDDRAALLHLVVDVEALAHILQFGDLETHHEFVASRRAVDRVARRVRPAMLERLEHRGHFLADVAGGVAMDNSCDSTHGSVPPYGRQLR